MQVKNVVLGIGIFIVYMLVLGYGIEAFYNSPQYDHFCNGTINSGPYPQKAYPSAPTVNCSFSQQLQNVTDLCYANNGQPVYNYDANGCSYSLKECNYCNKNYDSAQQAYSKNIFIIALIIGIITVVIGFAVLSVEPVGSALMASGIGAIFYGGIRNWHNLSDVLRFILLLVALVVLIWLALKLNKGSGGKHHGGGKFKGDSDVDMSRFKFWKK